MSTLAVSSGVDERAWWKGTLSPGDATDDRLVLWNYPVGKQARRQSRGRARSFLSRAPVWLSPEQSRSIVSICGHASATGEAAANEQLARRRAENVAAYLRTIGFAKLEIASAGSSQAADPAPTKQALARNRRVEVTLFNPTIQPPRRVDPTFPTTPPAPPTPAPRAPSGSATYWEGEFKWPPVPAPIESAVVAAEFTLVGKVKVKSVTGEPLQEVGFVTEGGELSVEVVNKIGESLEGKFGFNPGGPGESATAEVSLAGEVWNIPVEAGFQTELNFFKVEVSLGRPVLIGKLEINGVTLSCEFEGAIRGEFGPSKLLLERLGISAVEVGIAGAVAVGVLAVTAVIIGGTIYAGEAAKQRMAEVALDAATRDGAAARVTFEALGADRDVQEALNGRDLEWHKVGKESQDAFRSGSKEVGDYLDRLPDKGAEKKKAWAEKYGTNKNATDFDKIREEIVQELGAFQNDAPPVETLIRGL